MNYNNYKHAMGKADGLGLNVIVFGMKLNTNALNR